MKTLSYSAFCAGRGVSGLCLLILSASCVPAMTSAPTSLSSSAPAPESVLVEAALPAPPEPLALQPLAPDEAARMNAAIPVAAVDNPAARPFIGRSKAFVDQMRSLDCLTAAIYYEAASETDEGQRAVAQVVLNRVRHRAFPATVCGVVYQGSERSSGCQFSFTCDGSLLRTPSLSGWARARRLAAAALAGSVFAPVGYATHYHTHQVLPYWASSLIKSAVVGAHIFYRWNEGWGRPTAFRQIYAGREPLPGPNPKEAPASPLFSAAAMQAEVAAILKASATVEAPSAPAVAASPAGPIETPEAEQDLGGPRLPESHVLEAYRYSGMPKDQVPTGK